MLRHLIAATGHGVGQAYPALPRVRHKGEALMLRFYFEVARTAFRRQLVYRWANLAGLATNIFFGAIVSYVYIALFQANGPAGGAVNGFTLHDTLRYIWLIQALIMVVL